MTWVEGQGLGERADLVLSLLGRVVAEVRERHPADRREMRDGAQAAEARLEDRPRHFPRRRAAVVHNLHTAAALRCVHTSSEVLLHAALRCTVQIGSAGHFVESVGCELAVDGALVAHQPRLGQKGQVLFVVHGRATRGPAAERLVRAHTSLELTAAASAGESSRIDNL